MYRNSAIRFLCSLQLSALKQLRAYAAKIIPLLLNRKVLSTAKQRNELLEVICDFLKLFKDDISIIETLLRSLDGLNGILKESELLTILNTLLLWSESTLCTYVQAIITMIDSYSPFTNRNKWIDLKNRLYSIELKAHQTQQPFEEYEEVRSRLESSFDHSESSFSVAHSRLSNENTRMDNENSRLGNENSRLGNENSRLNNENSRFLNESSILSNKSNQRSNEISRISNENSSFSNEYNRTGNENSQLGMDRSRFNNEPSLVRSEHTQLSNGESWNRGKMEEKFNYCPIVFLFLFLFFSFFLVAFVSWKAPKQSTPVSTEEVYVSPNFDEWAQPSSSEIPEIGLFFTETQSQQESERVDETPTKPPPPINEFRDFIKPDHSSTTRIREEADAFIIEEVSETESHSSSSSTSSSGNSGNSGNIAGSEPREDLVEISFASDGLSLNVLLLTFLCVICTAFEVFIHV